MTSCFLCPSYAQGNQLPELVDRDGEQNRLLTVQEEVISDLLCHLHTHKSRAGLDSLEGTEGAGGKACQAALHHLS